MTAEVDDAVQFEDVKARMLARASARATDEHRVQARLAKRFGLGDKPLSRQKLYKWLADLADQHGEPVLRAISIAVAQSVSADRPDRYFCATVKRLICEANLASASSPEGSQW